MDAQKEEAAIAVKSNGDLEMYHLCDTYYETFNKVKNAEGFGSLAEMLLFKFSNGKKFTKELFKEFLIVPISLSLMIIPLILYAILPLFMEVGTGLGVFFTVIASVGAFGVFMSFFILLAYKFSGDIKSRGYTTWEKSNLLDSYNKSKFFKKLDINYKRPASTEKEVLQYLHWVKVALQEEYFSSRAKAIYDKFLGLDRSVEKYNDDVRILLNDSMHILTSTFSEDVSSLSVKNRDLVENIIKSKSLFLPLNRIDGKEQEFLEGNETRLFSLVSKNAQKRQSKK